jgi:hypothetical protein
MAKISVHGGPTDHTAPAVEEEKPTPEETVEAPVEDRPVEEETVEALGELLAEVVPEGTVDEVIAWTEDDPSPPARLVTALDAEQAKPTPRVTLVTELERRLAQF